MLLLIYLQRRAGAAFCGCKSSVSSLRPSAGKIMKGFMRPGAKIRIKVNIQKENHLDCINDISMCARK